MKFSIATLFAAAVSAAPSSSLDARGDVQTVDLVFHAAATSFNMSFPADGEFHAIGHDDLNINIIDTPSFDALHQCTFQTSSTATYVGNFADDGTAQVVVGPPQPITAVKCWGSCVPIYGDCYINGQSVGACCSGYCAANKCRPWF